MQIKRFQFNPFEENTYIAYDETKEAVIIDCGAYYDEEKDDLMNFVEENQLKITHLLNTHLHLDHAFGLAFAHEKFGVKPQYHKDEIELLPRLEQQASAFGFKMDEEEILADKFLTEGDIISFGNSALIAILTPGHSPGSLCFYSEAGACLFVGDVIFRGGIGRSDLWGGNHDQLIREIKEKLLILSDDTAIYPGHGPVTTVKYEKNSNPFL